MQECVRWLDSPIEHNTLEACSAPPDMIRRVIIKLLRMRDIVGKRSIKRLGGYHRVGRL